MTNLRGSEKQIQWAEKIRAKWVEEGHEKIEKNLIDAIIPVTKPEYQEKVAEIVENIKNIDSAKWWIDNRSYLEVHSGNYADRYRKQAMSLFAAAAKESGAV
jgi:hypothetical protein